MQDGDRYGIVKTAANYADNAGQFVTAGRNLLFDEALFSENNRVMDYHHNHSVAQVRSALMSTILHNNKIVVRAIGTLERRAGDIINMVHPNQDNLQEPNTSFDGTWLILSIKHIITNNQEYTQNIMLAKNARKTEERMPEASGSVVL